MTNSSANKSTNQLSIQDKDKSKTQSKEQKRFDSLTKRIEALEINLEKEQQKLDAAVQEYNNKLYPLEMNIVEKKLKFVFKLDEESQKHKLSKKQKEIVAEVIKSEMDDVFEQQEPTKIQEELYDKWSKISYKEEVEQQEFFERGMFEASIKFAFNGEIDTSDFEDTPEGRKRMQERIEAFYEEKTKEFKASQQNKKPTKREQLQAQAEELKSKNIRSIYISLVKVLHPDSEQDEVLKIQKNELMKKVTAAYENKDIATLLRLEAEWISQTTDRLDNLTNDTLKLYNETLYQRVRELEHKKFMLRRNPAYEKIQHFLHLNQKRITSEIDKIVTSTHLNIIEIDESIELVGDSDTKAKFVEFVSDYLEFTLGGGDNDDELDFYNAFFR
ncbi:hypothetical protein [uncultured Cytophaga sp.]|uniref:hypothetical protein n=1 Tax=uncultured Cytophaga sp. TaxID=160238 RepID=UPI00261320A5|nr:hypothetical protein [uncultured Cytophaga sp.]